jgi:O-antigen/teichoic acid export membrane protein
VIGAVRLLAVLILLALYLYGHFVATTRSVFTGVSLQLGITTIVLVVGRLLLSPVSFIPSALQRFDISAKINMFFLVGSQILGVVGVYKGGGIQWLITVQALSVVLTGVVYSVIAKKLLPWLSWSWNFRIEVMRSVIRSGFWVAVQGGFQTILAQFDKLVVGTIVGPSAVTYYSNAQVIPEKMVGAVTSTTGVLFPYLSRDLAEGGDRIARVFFQTLRLSVPLITILTGGVMLYGPLLLRLWLGTVAEQSVVPLFFLAITYALLAWFSIVSSVLYGLRRVKLLAGFTTLLAVGNCSALAILIPRYGVLGAAIAYLVAALPVPWCVLYTARVIGCKEGLFSLIKHGIVHLSKGIVCAVVALFISWFLIARVSSTWFGLLFGSISAGASFIVLYYWGGFLVSEDKELCTRITGMIRSRYFKKI